MEVIAHEVFSNRVPATAALLSRADTDVQHAAGLPGRFALPPHLLPPP